MHKAFSISPSLLAYATRLLLGTALMTTPLLAAAFNSGSTGADGDFNPTLNTQLQLPPDGIFNYKSVNIPQGVTVTFKRNAANTPVYMLVQNDATIAGTIDVSGGNAADVGSAGDGNMTDDGTPGVGGPGGFDGGWGGIDAVTANCTPTPSSVCTGTRGGNGQGPGGGVGAGLTYDNYGNPNPNGGHSGLYNYGNNLLQPLVGGSGGGGGSGHRIYLRGSGGGGGGGAILLAVTGKTNLTGSILANGGSVGKPALTFTTPFNLYPSVGGCGSGGGIRIVSSQLSGNGSFLAQGGNGNCYSPVGGDGRIRLEADQLYFTGTTTPTFYTSTPNALFVPNLPHLAITTVANQAVPSNPSGMAQVTLAATTANPVNVVVASSGVPVGTNVALTVKPEIGADPITATPVAITGNQSAGTATLSVNLPDGASVLEASTSFIITAAVGDALARYANNERVEKVTLTASTGGPGLAILTTVSGKTYRVPQSVLSGS
ncbi:MAG: hypothetical protein DM484_17245 [Candidatus Methylumidiphilus alinenensis]|uniref:Uncharacterized protein n=1 Tax=Candidatus Methylumidiphilus alinenensis TaxID=2202197 RepID=A0A2W4QXT2_9GAMM|nr:MAG: hypothetical protein DM484_17245 [Candidatus Methylumidiphilus alinenensis]